METHPLTEYRKQASLSLEAFGRLVGHSKVAVWKWEHGVCMPRRQSLQKIAEITGGFVTANDFVSANPARCPGDAPTVPVPLTDLPD